MTPQAERGNWRWHVGAFGLYIMLSVIFIDHGASITRNILGVGSDPYLFTWFLAWWPWSVAHHLNPLYTNLVWQPVGLHIAWTTCVPLLALAGAPITLLWGPAATYNVLTLAAPVLSACSAYLLSLRLTGNPLSSVIAGYLFGFSTYEMAETLSHLNLDFNFLLPLLLLAVMERLETRLPRAHFIAYASAILALQFYISVEIFATMIFFAFVVWFLAFCLLQERRATLRRLLVDGAIIAPLVILLTSPLLWPMLMRPRDVVIPAGWSYVSAAHFFNLIVPSPETVLANPKLRYLNDGLFGIPASDATTGLPLLIILLLYARKNWRNAEVQFAYMSLALILLASMGPQLWLGPMFTKFVLPWRVILYVPLINAALPVRFALYSSLIIAMLAAYWISGTPGAPQRLRLVFGLLECSLLTPALHPVKPIPALNFFAPGRLQAILGPEPRLLILPQRTGDPSAFWQAENRFGFAQTQGYLGFPPQSMRFHPAVRDFMFGWRSAHLGQDISELTDSTSTQYVIAGPDTPPELLQAMDKLSWPKRAVDGTMIFAVPAANAQHG